VVPRTEGRWSLVPWGLADTETLAINQARRLLDRCGVVTRELADMEGGLLPWRVLYEVLSRMEWAGEVRRGYFVEGLAGAQFAWPEALEALTRQDAHANGPVVLLNTMDPANVHGSGGLFELPWPARRQASNWLAIKNGRPLFVLEQSGRRVTTMPSATPDELATGAACLKELFQTGLGSQLRGKLIIEEWNGAQVASGPGKDYLEAAGFVRDYQAMTLYAGWS
jgi:ATP-dependent Lhr-like helicase